MKVSLGDNINVATRPHHTKLNKQILRLLPLALPPHTPTPFLYHYGMSNFLPLYSAFESSFRNHILQHRPLLCLHIPDLERSSRLQHDLEQLAIDPHLHSPTLANQNGSEDDDISEDNPQLQAFVSHIRSCLAAKPHLIVAYTWIFYMAIFSGGRYIRAKLRDAGNEFWTSAAHLENKQESHNSKNPAEEIPLSFWNFAGASDGEDLKADYKARILDLEMSLTAEERRDIVDEAVNIMCRLLEIVNGIDVSIASGKYTQSSYPIVAADDLESPAWPTLLVKHLLPMGLAELLTGIQARFMSSRTNSAAPVAVAVAVKTE